MKWRREKPQGVGSCFCGEGTEKAGESAGEALSPEVGGEKEKEWKHPHGTEQEREKEASIPLGLYKQVTAESEIL